MDREWGLRFVVRNPVPRPKCKSDPREVVYRYVMAGVIVGVIAACGSTPTQAPLTTQTGRSATPAAKSSQLPEDDGAYGDLRAAAYVSGDVHSGPMAVVERLFPADTGQPCDITAEPDPCPVGIFFAGKAKGALETTESQFMCHCAEKWTSASHGTAVPVTSMENQMFFMIRVTFTLSSGPIVVDVLVNEQSGSKWYAIDTWCDGRPDTSIPAGNGNNC